MERVISGIRPTGNLHLGNYFGAVKSFVKMQDEYDCMFFIADWHSLTTHPTPADIKKSVKTILSEYLACGIDPEKAPIYVQSDVKQVLELYLYLNMNAYLGELERVTSFKEKVRKQPDNVNAGLLTYPCLMAADILVHKADKVPVGKDQEQNMEMARLFARRFNRIYGVEYFKEPASFHFMRAVTDQGPTQLNQEKPEVIQNLFTLCELLSGKEAVEYYNDLYNRMEIRYGDMKKQMAADANALLAPIRERILAYSSDDALLDRIMRQGAEAASARAEKTIEEVREIIGFRKI